MTTLSQLETDALDAFLARVRAALGARVGDVVLFGSRARGEGHAASDLDLLVLIDDASLAERRAVQDAAHDVSLEQGVTLAPLLRPRAFLSGALPLARAIARDGVRL